MGEHGVVILGISGVRVRAALNATVVYINFFL